MHIPMAETKEIEIEPFYEALEKAKEQTTAEYEVRNWLYVPNYYGEYRYMLGTTGK